MPLKKLTTRFCDTVKVEARTDFQDEIVRGLSLRVTPGGVKTWNIRYRSNRDGSKSRINLGRFPSVTLEKARTKALKVVTSIAEGGDPAAKHRANRDALTVEQLGELFIEKHGKRHKKTWPQDLRNLTADVYPTLGNMKARLVKRRDILDILEVKEEAGHFAQARLVLATVRKMFNWAVDNEYLEASPAAAIKSKGKLVRRDRVLSEAEIKQIWDSLPDAALTGQVKDILRLLLFTGQRSGEVCGIVRSEIDLEAATWTIPSNRTKNELAHVVPLSTPALEILQSRILPDLEGNSPLFSRVGKPIESNAIAKAVRLKMQLEGERWTPHDFRRTVSTGMANIGVQPHIVEVCLNHVSGFRSGVAGIYNRATYENEKRNALLRWAEHLDGVLTGNNASVVQLKARA